ncbi:MAG TPA: acyl-CoA reductase [Longimicrobiales bacterium]|nr:acyl-CoA reductase [Longimicrobiales bacterium]
MSADGFEALAVPPGVQVAATTPEWVAELCQRLQDAGGALARRDAPSIAAALGRVGERFLDGGDPLRKEALERLPSTSGLSSEMAAAVLDGMAADWTGARLAALLRAELGEPCALDGFVERGESRVLAIGPRLCVQIVAGSVPGVGVTALLRSLLVKGPTLLKPGGGDVVLPVLFARALAEADPVLGAAAAVVYWPGGSRALEGAALKRADVATAYGSDATVGELRARTPVTARFVAYHHRVSVGVVGREALGPAALERTASEVARALALFDQRGCVSPQLVYVERGGQSGGGRSPQAFAEALAGALRALEHTLPTGALDAAEASALHQARGTAELMAGHGGSGEARVFHGGPAAWTVLYEPEPQSLPPLAGRFARVRPLESLERLPQRLEPLRGHLQTVGYAGLGPRVEALARELGRMGAVRVTPFAAVPFPPPWWHHDGRGPLGELVRWVDLEPG